MDWKSKLILDNGKIASNSIYNAILLIDNLYPGIYGHDAKLNETWIIKSPPWQVVNGSFKIKPLDNNDVVMMMAELELYGLQVNAVITRQAINAVASKIDYHPISREMARDRVNPFNFTPPPEWIEIIREATEGQRYASPKDLLIKVVPDKKMHTARNHRRVTSALRYLNFYPRVEFVPSLNKAARVWRRFVDAESPLLP